MARRGSPMAPTTEVHQHSHLRPSVPASQPQVLSNVLNEVRNVLVGASLLLSGLLTAAFAPRFPELTNTERVFYGISLLFVLVADVLLIASAPSVTSAPSESWRPWCLTW